MAAVQVLLAESIHSNAQRVLREAGFGVHTAPGGLDSEALIARLQALPEGPVAVGVRSKTKVRTPVFEAVPRLAAVGCFCIGTDQVDLDHAARTAVAVFNAPFSNTRSVAELVIGEVIMLSRQIFPRSMAAHRGVWEKSARGAHEVRGKTLGIIGYGHIGTQVSVLAESMGMRVIFHDIMAKLPLGNAESRESLRAVLGESDFVTLHVPDTELTRLLIGPEEIAAIKPGAFLLNASRGQVVDLDALRSAIESGAVGGAAIDVYPKEPAAQGDEFKSPLRGLDQVILTPHIGGSTQEAQANIGVEVGEKLVGYFRDGVSETNITAPRLAPAPVRAGRTRIMNHHQNVPGVLSRINNVIADSGLNITGQGLGTREEMGMLLVDLAIPRDDARLVELVAAIDGMPTSVRTRIL
jgi:D-3-phosphoglycerate dehydrogenase